MSLTDYSDEHRLLIRWSKWCDRSDTKSILTECGLSASGSPPAIAPVSGVADEESVTGYAKEHRLPDAISPEIDLFMASLIELKPTVFKALLLRYRRIVHGQHYLIRSERWMAGMLYDLPPRYAHIRLVHECDSGYKLLRKFIEETGA